MTIRARVDSRQINPWLRRHANGAHPQARFMCRRNTLSELFDSWQLLKCRDWRRELYQGRGPNRHGTARTGTNTAQQALCQVHRAMRVLPLQMSAYPGANLGFHPCHHSWTALNKPFLLADYMSLLPPARTALSWKAQSPPPLLYQSPSFLLSEEISNRINIQDFCT